MIFSLNIRSITNFLASLLLLASALVAVAAVPAQAAKSDICRGANLDLRQNAPTCGTDNQSRLEGVIKLIVNLLSVVIGIIAVIMVIISGFRYITSSGDSGKIAAAKSTLIYAIVGLIIVALAQVIVRFVLSRVG